MFLKLLLLVAGLALIIVGADVLVDGSSAIARKAGISEFVIGLTIVGFGTSCPELVVSLTGALSNSADISIGNVIGSNIFNTLLILGLTAMISPIAITRDNKRLDIPATLAVTTLLILCGMSKTILHIGQYDGLSRLEGIVFLALFCIYIFFCFKNSPDIGEQSDTKDIKLVVAILFVLGGLVMLVFGGRLFVNNAVVIARRVGLSDKFVAITLLAGGTSLPELATCVVAAIKKKGQLALGNILGSNIFNILLILGCSAVVTPLHFHEINLVDMGILMLSAILIWTSAYTGKKDILDRFDGSLMLLCEIAYMAWLIISI